MSRIVCLALLIMGNLKAQEVFYVRKIVRGPMLNVKMEVVNSKKEVVFSRDSAPSEAYMELRSFPPLLFIMSPRGAHSERVEVVNVGRKEILFYRNSSWPVNLTKQGSRVKLSWTEEGPSPDSPKEFEKWFDIGP